MTVLGIAQDSGQAVTTGVRRRSAAPTRPPHAPNPTATASVASAPIMAVIVGPAHASAQAIRAVIAPDHAAFRGPDPVPNRPTTNPPPNAATASARNVGSAT